MKKENNTMTERLIAIRKELKMDQTRFSMECDISYSLLTKIESNKIQISDKLKNKIGEKYGIGVKNWLETGLGDLQLPQVKTVNEVEVLIKNNTYLQEQLAAALSIVASLTRSSRDHMGLVPQ